MKQNGGKVYFVRLDYLPAKLLLLFSVSSVVNIRINGPGKRRK